MNRVLGLIEGSEGPLTILIGGIHGNESAGIKAIQQIFSTIRAQQIPLKGTLVGLAGNLQAIAKNKRYIDYDLNRCWDPKFIQNIHQQHHNQAEDIELYNLHETIMSYRDYPGTKIIMDLHTTSSAKGNFIVIPQSEATHPLVRSLKQPVVVDLDEYLKGTLLKYFRDLGFLSFAFEGGLIGSTDAINLHVAGIWEILVGSGSVEASDVESSFTYILDQYSSALPHYLKVLYHHWIEPDDQFVMVPGFENFQPVKQGEHLADDKEGPIQAPVSGLIFLPLYQSSGNDGFFIVEEISTMELTADG